ncbi:hypothetical protein D3C86_1979100 [compost metagenome]
MLSIVKVVVASALAEKVKYLLAVIASAADAFNHCPEFIPSAAVENWFPVPLTGCVKVTPGAAGRLAK